MAQPFFAALFPITADKLTRRISLAALGCLIACHLSAPAAGAGSSPTLEALELYMQNPDMASLVFDGSAQHSAAGLVPVGPAVPFAGQGPAGGPAAGAPGAVPPASAPRLSEVPAPAAEQPEQIAPDTLQARELAFAAIRKDTFSVEVPGQSAPREVVTAGSDHFKTLWTRDACFSMYGLVGDERGRKIMKDTLQTFFDRASREGQLPRRMGDHTNIELVAYSVFGLKTPDLKQLAPVEYDNELKVAQLDCTALPVIQAYEYYKATGDIEFIRKNYYTLRRAAAWLARRTDGGLIDQPGSADWKDVMRRSGKVAYTNMLLYKAFDSMALLAEAMNDSSAAAECRGLAEATKTAINKEIWNDKTGYYRDSNEAPEAFSADGNILAVIFGVADKARTDSIMAKFEYFLKADPLPFPALEGDYPDNKVPFWMGLAGVRHYHDRFVWPWQGNVFAVAAVRAGRTDLAVKALNKVAAQAVKDGTFYEIYKLKKGEMRPVRTFIYKSEPDFLWSSGTYLWAYREVTRALSSAGQ